MIFTHRPVSILVLLNLRATIHHGVLLHAIEIEETALDWFTSCVL